MEGAGGRWGWGGVGEVEAVKGWRGRGVSEVEGRKGGRWKEGWGGGGRYRGGRWRGGGREGEGR